MKQKNNMETKEIAERFHKVKEELTKKFKEKGMNQDQIKIELNSLDTEFLTHAFVNGKFLKESNNAERFDFYVRFLETVLNE